jgi:YidC/Oxa1 family membrane protein insertase
MYLRHWLRAARTVLLGGAMVAFVWNLPALFSPYLWLLHFCRGWTSDWGQAILAAAIINRLLLAVLGRMSQPAQKVLALDPEIAAIRRSYANDPKTRQEEIEKVYHRHKISGWTLMRPLHFAVLQWWALVAFFVAVWRIPALHGAPFLWVPNLSEPDPLYLLPLTNSVVAALNFLAEARKRITQPGYLRAMLLLFLIVAGVSSLLPAGFVLALTADRLLLSLVSPLFRRLLRQKSARP